MHVSIELKGQGRDKAFNLITLDAHSMLHLTLSDFALSLFIDRHQDLIRPTTIKQLTLTEGL